MFQHVTRSCYCGDYVRDCYLAILEMVAFDSRKKDLRKQIEKCVSHHAKREITIFVDRIKMRILDSRGVMRLGVVGTGGGG
jgi:hypothetical protein